MLVQPSPLCPHGGDGQVAHAGHVLRRVPGADAGGVFAVGDVTDIVQLVLDSPVPADVDRDGGRGAGLGGHAGDAGRGDVGSGAAAQVGDVPFDQERPGGVREDAVRGGQDLDGADLVASVPAGLQNGRAHVCTP